MGSPSLKRAHIEHFRGLQEITPGLYRAYNSFGWCRCQQCGQVWSPTLQTEGRLPRGWWKCPNGCNSDVKNT